MIDLRTTKKRQPLDSHPMLMEKPIPFDSTYIMKPGMTYYDVCVGMRLNEKEIPLGIRALEILNGPEKITLPKPRHDRREQ
jgi:hypothetical protein